MTYDAWNLLFAEVLNRPRNMITPHMLYSCGRTDKMRSTLEPGADFLAEVSAAKKMFVTHITRMMRVTALLAVYAPMVFCLMSSAASGADMPFAGPKFG